MKVCVEDGLLESKGLRRELWIKEHCAILQLRSSQLPKDVSSVSLNRYVTGNIAVFAYTITSTRKRRMPCQHQIGVQRMGKYTFLFRKRHKELTGLHNALCGESSNSRVFDALNSRGLRYFHSFFISFKTKGLCLFSTVENVVSVQCD